MSELTPKQIRMPAFAAGLAAAAKVAKDAADLQTDDACLRDFANDIAAAIRALQPAVAVDDAGLEHVALRLYEHDAPHEGYQWTWPEHKNDDGYREGGYVYIVPSDIQARYRDKARAAIHAVNERAALPAVAVAREPLEPFPGVTPQMREAYEFAQGWRHKAGAGDDAAVVEGLAQIIYAAMCWAVAHQPFVGGTPDWQADGNSYAQDRAREAARAAIAAQQPVGVVGASLLRDVNEPFPPGCYCEPGQCMAPRQFPCRDPQKAAQQPVGVETPPDVRRLVIAARNVAFDSSPSEEALKELDTASEAFAERVPWATT